MQMTGLHDVGGEKKNRRGGNRERMVWKDFAETRKETREPDVMG